MVDVWYLFQYLQNPAEKRVKFKVFVVRTSSTLTDFMRDENISSNEMDQVFYELLADDNGHNLVHYVEVATIDGSEVRIPIIIVHTMMHVHAYMQYISTLNLWP